jgi:hypothetical protein
LKEFIKMPDIVYFTYLLLDPRLESAACPLFASSSVLISDLFASILDSPDSSERVVFGLLSKKLK